MVKLNQKNCVNRVWLKRLLALVLIYIGVWAAIRGSVIAETMPLRFSGPGILIDPELLRSEEFRVAFGKTLFFMNVLFSPCLQLSTFFIALVFFLPKPRIYAKPRKPRLASFFYYATLLFLSCMVTSIMSVNLVKMLVYRGLLPRDLHTYMSVPIQIFLLAASSMYMMYRIFRLPTASDLVANDDRPPYVYLRSFEYEKKYRVVPDFLRMRSFFRGIFGSPHLETVIATALEKHGPFVALGKPDQRLPVDGAARDIVDSDWKSHIASFFQISRAIFVVPATTTGLGWEISWLHSNNMLDKLVIVIPPRFHFKKWQEFASSTRIESMMQVPTKDEVLKSVILFVQNGRLIPIEGKRWERGYRRAIQHFVAKTISSNREYMGSQENIAK